jgi:hypothetical protein
METLQFNNILNDIFKMTAEEKLHIVQLITESLVSDLKSGKATKKKKFTKDWDEDIPDWQIKILESRMEQIENGTAEFTSWDEAKQRIMKNIEEKR